MPRGYLNQVGGNDELVFDGGSFVMAPDGGLLELPTCREMVQIWDSSVAVGPAVQSPAAPQSTDELLLRALVLGVRDYARKWLAGPAGFKRWH